MIGRNAARIIEADGERPRAAARRVDAKPDIGFGHIAGVNNTARINRAGDINRAAEKGGSSVRENPSPTDVHDWRVDEHSHLAAARVRKHNRPAADRAHNNIARRRRHIKSRAPRARRICAINKPRAISDERLIIEGLRALRRHRRTCGHIAAIYRFAYYMRNARGIETLAEPARRWDRK
ncbi:MAG: hypothetical protein M0R66_05425 [Candidatus Omnitrophica bacterium]|nr:hypothetical protein [Candidatus Omnitrophota bacterium]